MINYWLKLPIESVENSIIPDDECDYCKLAGCRYVYVYTARDWTPFTYKLYTICNKHYLQWQKAIMPITDLQRKFPPKQVHLQFNFPIKNVQYWVSEIPNIYCIYIYVFLGNNACCTRNHIYLNISLYNNTPYSHDRDIPDCQLSY